MVLIIDRLRRAKEASAEKPRQAQTFQRGPGHAPERPEAQRGPERPREAQRGPERARDAKAQFKSRRLQPFLGFRVLPHYNTEVRGVAGGFSGDRALGF